MLIHNYQHRPEGCAACDRCTYRAAPKLDNNHAQPVTEILNAPRPAGT